MTGLLRAWVGLVGVIALVNAAQCFLNQDHAKNTLYTKRPQEATALVSRLFGTWTLLAGFVRLAFAFWPHVESIYYVTLLTFVLAFVHFATEMFIYGTATPSFPTIAPLLISSVTAMWLVIAML